MRRRAACRCCRLPGLARPRCRGAGQRRGRARRCDCVQWAARAALRGEVAALVTAPLHKEALSAAGVDYPGHTELLQAEAATHQGVPLACHAGAHDAGQRRVAHGAGQHSCVAARRHCCCDPRPTCCRPCRSPMRHCCAPWGVRRASLWQGSTPMLAKVACLGGKSSKALLPLWPNCARKGWMCTAPCAGHRVHARSPYVEPIPGEFDVVMAMYHDQGLDSGEIPGRGQRGERHPGPAAGAHQPRPRHRVRHCRARCGRCRQPDRSGAHGAPTGQ
jgi:4-hydroxythreonine-4-phosphate dehydrogenase